MNPLITIPDRPNPDAVTEMRFYDGSNNLEYVGYARSKVLTRWRKDAGAFTSIVVSSNVATVNKTAHGLLVNQRVDFLGATVDTDLNGSRIIASVPNANSFTVATASVADATYTENTLEIQTYAPPTSAPVWAIKRIFNPGATASRIAWAEGKAAFDQVLDNRATLAYS